MTRLRYALKAGLVFGDTDSLMMFGELREALERHLRVGDWFVDADTWTGRPTRLVAESLQAFWPGVLALLGERRLAARHLNAFWAIWRSAGQEADSVSAEQEVSGSSSSSSSSSSSVRKGFRGLPEEFDVGLWAVPGMLKADGTVPSGSSHANSGKVCIQSGAGHS